MKIKQRNTGRTHFEKGHIPWNKGRKHSDETKEKIRIAHTGRKLSEETKQKIRIKLKGNQNSKNYKHSKQFKENLRKRLIENQYAKGCKHTEEMNKKKGKRMKKLWENPEYKEKISIARSGENHYNWQNGKSFEPYSIEFNENLKEKIRNRDNRTCQKCGKTERENGQKLDVHHINYDKKNCNRNNLIALCLNCNIKVNLNRNYWINYFQGVINAYT